MMLPHGHISLLVLSEESWWTMPSFGHPSFYLQMRLNLHDQLKVECKKQSMQFTKNKPSLSDARRLASTHLSWGTGAVRDSLIYRGKAQ